MPVGAGAALALKRELAAPLVQPAAAKVTMYHSSHLQVYG
jgi:hypothetical protein